MQGKVSIRDAAAEMLGRPRISDPLQLPETGQEPAPKPPQQEAAHPRYINRESRNEYIVIGRHVVLRYVALDNVIVLDFPTVVQAISYASQHGEKARR